MWARKWSREATNEVWALEAVKGVGEEVGARRGEREKMIKRRVKATRKRNSVVRDFDRGMYLPPILSFMANQLAMPTKNTNTTILYILLLCLYLYFF